MTRLMDTPTFIVDKLPTLWPIPDGSIFWVRSIQGNLSVSTSASENDILRVCLKIIELNVDNFSTEAPDCEGSGVGTRLLFHNSSVNFWEFRLAPGEFSVYHNHKLPYCFINLPSGSGATLTQEISEDGKTVGVPNYLVDWETVYIPEQLLSSHAVKNIGESCFRQVIIEFIT
jgi:hypothetical protein